MGKAHEHQGTKYKTLEDKDVQKAMLDPAHVVHCPKFSDKYEWCPAKDCLTCEHFMGMLPMGKDPNRWRIICHHPITLRMDRIRLDGDK